MKKVLIIALFICIFYLTGCEKVSDSFKTYGDFIYEVVQINEEGKDIKQKGIKNKTVVETFVRIRGLSEEGKTKETIVVPQYIDGIEVKEIGHFGMPRGNWNTRVLKKVYIPFMPKLINNVIPINNIIVLTNVVPDDVKLYEYIYITSYYHEDGNLTNYVPEVYGEHHHMCRYANVSFMYNYDEAPNSGYYWIDDCDYGTNITYIPNNPTRDGYIFDGWYKEKECINKWDFEVDKLPEEINPGDHSNSYQETILFAKWIKDE